MVSGEQSSIDKLLIIISDLTEKVNLLTDRVEEIERENKELKLRLAKYETPKNSRNSSIPPSKDEHRPKRTNSLRESTGRNPGGQKGREGKTLLMSSTPDETIEIKPDFCQSCGNNLSDVLGQKRDFRQVVDIPLIRSTTIEYQVFGKTCKCGHTTVSDFPCGVNAPVSYGQNIEGLIGYFHARQYVPFARMQEMFNDVFKINISEGGIHYLLNRFASKVGDLYEMIKQRVEQSKVVGSDETGAKVNGKMNWFWTWQTQKLTFIAHSDNRGKNTIDKWFPAGFPNSTLVHDAWKPQLNTKAKHHQSCLAHLQRNIKYLNELYKGNKWGNRFLKILYDALELERSMVNQDYFPDNRQRDDIIKRFDKLLRQPPGKKHKELQTFYKRILRDREHIFTCLFIPEVPPDNNASERAIRNIKVKQKISGQFKCAKAAQNFAKIRSVIDTTIKNKLNVIEALSLVSIFGLETTD